MANTYKALSTVTVGAGGASTITFSNIPQTYTDLMVMLSVRTNRGFNNDSLGLEVNGSTASRTGQVLYGDSNAAGATNTTSEVVYAGLTGNNSTANTFSVITVYCPNYAGSNAKSFSADGVTENNATLAGAAYQSINAWLWNNTSPVTSLTFTSATGNSFVQYSTATLYGVYNTDVSTAPAAPTIGTATAGNASATVAFTGVSGASLYTATSTPGSLTGTGTTSPITVSGLTNGTAYTFKVKGSNPIGTGVESAASNSVTPTAAAYDSIASTVVGAGGASEITFSGIPATYQHLQLRWFAPSSQTTATSWCLYVGNNGIATSGYTYHTIYAYGNPAVGATTRPNESQIEVHYVPAGSTTPLAGIIDIFDYANTNKNKSIRSLSGHVNTASGNGSQNWVTGGAWLSNDAITHVRFQFGTGGNTMPQYTRVALYGIKG